MKLGSIRAFFKPAVGRTDKQGAGRQPSPAAAAPSAAAAAVAAGEQTAAAQAPAPPGALQQFVRKRKLPSPDAEAVAPAAGSSGAAHGMAVNEAAPATTPPRAAAEGEALPAAPGGCKASGTRPLTQLYLDVGQRDFHSYRCPTCGMLYARGTDADERLHAAFHASTAQGPRYLGWQGERVVAVDGSRGRLLLFSSADVGRVRKPLLELCGFLEEQMGLPRGWLLRVPLTLLLYVSASKRIQACVAAEAVRAAFPVLPSLSPSMQQGMRSCGSAAMAASSGAAGSGDGDGRRAGPLAAAPAAAAAHVAASAQSLLSVTLSSGTVAAALTSSQACTAVAPADDARQGPQQPQQANTPRQQEQQQQNTAQETAACAATPLVLDRRQRVRAACGVRLMWVSLQARRRGLATRLLDCCRCQFMPGYVLPRHELAFSAPTDAGRAFIEAYTNTRRFLVYE